VPTADQCVDTEIPPFLGGGTGLAEMTLSDMEVAWHLTGQLLVQARRLPPGTEIGEIDIR
jgi:hypothetical protein